jgi:Skp family chaperone for outer membrane proteins
MLRAAAVLTLGIALAQSVAAQDAPATTVARDPVPTLIPTPVLTLDQDRLFRDSLFGKASIARSDAREAALLAENSQIFIDLEAEEKALTTRRATATAAEFSAQAAAFDAKAQRIRAEQDAKGQEIARLRQDDQRQFFDAALPVLAGLMSDLGAVAILDKKAVILSFDKVDMTDAAIARVDGVLGAGTAPQTPVPQPDPVPTLTPAPAPVTPEAPTEP